MDNPEIARTLEEVADILEIQNANPFRIRAYRNAVRTVETVTVPLRRWVEERRQPSTTSSCADGRRLADTAAVENNELLGAAGYGGGGEAS